MIAKAAARAEQRHDQADEQAHPEAREQASGRDLAVGEPTGDALDLLEVGADDQAVLHRELVVGEVVDGLLCLLVLLVDAEGQREVEGERRGGDPEVLLLAHGSSLANHWSPMSSLSACSSPPASSPLSPPSCTSTSSCWSRCGGRTPRRGGCSVRRRRPPRSPSRWPTTRASTTSSSPSVPSPASALVGSDRSASVALIVLRTGSMLDGRAGAGHLRQVEAARRRHPGAVPRPGAALPAGLGALAVSASVRHASAVTTAG